MLSRRQMLATVAATAATPVTTVSLSGCGPGPRRPAGTKAPDKVTYLTGFGTTPREDGT